MNLRSIRENIVDLHDLAQLDIHRRIRVSRSTVKEKAITRKRAGAKKTKASKLLQSLSSEERAALIKELKENKE